MIKFGKIYTNYLIMRIDNYCCLQQSITLNILEQKNHLLPSIFRDFIQKNSKSDKFFISNLQNRFQTLSLLHSHFYYFELVLLRNSPPMKHISLYIFSHLFKDLVVKYLLIDSIFFQNDYKYDSSDSLSNRAESKIIDILLMHSYRSSYYLRVLASIIVLIFQNSCYFNSATPFTAAKVSISWLSYRAVQFLEKNDSAVSSSFSYLFSETTSSLLGRQLSRSAFRLMITRLSLNIIFQQRLFDLLIRNSSLFYRQLFFSSKYDKSRPQFYQFLAIFFSLSISESIMANQDQTSSTYIISQTSCPILSFFYCLLVPYWFQTLSSILASRCYNFLSSFSFYYLYLLDYCLV